METDATHVTPQELRDATFRKEVRGYDPAVVRTMLERAAVTIERLQGDPGAAHGAAPVSARELRNAELPPALRGVHRDAVNELCERAAATIDALSRDAQDSGTARVTARPGGTRTPLIGRGTAAAESDRESVRVSLGTRSYYVVIGAGVSRDVAALARTHGARRAVVVTQQPVADHVAPIVGALQSAGIPSTTLAIPDGEAGKTLSTVNALCEAMAEWGLLRGDMVIALGGGVVGDTAGFAASVYYRGVAVVQVPTTLLAMVDAAIGGKTAVNLPQGKNLVGAFHQPLGVLADPAVLTSLPDREYRCGLGEVLKYALMGDAELRSIVEHESVALLERSPDVLRRAITRSAAVKAHYVSADEHERTGLREQLNYGHTLAHAIETVADHELAHGEAVSVGLVFAGALAGALERISPQSADQHRSFAESLGLPVRVPAGPTREELLRVMRRDKKAVGGLRFVLQGPDGLQRVDDPPAHALDAAFAAVDVTD